MTVNKELVTEQPVGGQEVNPLPPKNADHLTCTFFTVTGTI